LHLLALLLLLILLCIFFMTIFLALLLNTFSVFLALFMTIFLTLLFCISFLMLLLWLFFCFFIVFGLALSLFGALLLVLVSNIMLFIGSTLVFCLTIQARFCIRCLGIQTPRNGACLRGLLPYLRSCIGAHLITVGLAE